MISLAKRTLQRFSTSRNRGLRGSGSARTGRDKADFGQVTLEVFDAVKPYTMTSIERVASLCNAVEYLVANDIPGSFVECGVWKGGSMMAVALTLHRLGIHDRELFLFDTFEGMTAPEAIDRDCRGAAAAALLETSDKDTSWVWARSNLEDVQTALASTGYDVSRMHFVIGPVEETLPHDELERVALLRLDTDWYKSTRHELEYLYPLLTVGGVLIVDDYGHWEGARRAVDEYVSEHNIPLFLSRIDYTGRLAIKPGSSCHEV